MRWLPLALTTAMLWSAAPARKKKVPAKKSAPARLETIQATLTGTEGCCLTNAAALEPFFEQLAAIEAGGDRLVRILQYGDSHTAADEWTGHLRRLFQARFGDGGPGFAFAGKPYRYYRRVDVKATATPGWKTSGLLTNSLDGLDGLGGISVYATRPGETVTIAGAAEKAMLLYLQQPGGGMLHLGNEVISTNGDFTPMQVELAPGEELRAEAGGEGPLRLFGWVLENRRGITWEPLGINGAPATLMLGWNEEILAAHLAQRSPALLVLSYGSNEATAVRWDPNEYRNQLDEVLRRFRLLAPEAALLFAGPPDGMRRASRRGAFRELARLDEIEQIQRDLVVAHNGAYWSWRNRMGGRGSIAKWVSAGAAQADRIHLTAPGYRLSAEALAGDLISEYAKFRRRRDAALSPVNNGSPQPHP